MNGAELIRCPTLFARAREKGVKAALLTSKKKTLELFHKDVEIGIAAEAPTQKQIERYGRPADIYSREINYWLWQVAIDILEERPDITVLYVHITDYPMHAWGPEQPESKEHLETLDRLLAQALETAPDAAFLATADHGMNYKKRCWDLNKVLAEQGVPPRFVLSPERDYYIVHHRNFTGCSWIWLNHPDDADQTRLILKQLTGVEEVLSREEAVARFHLTPEHIGDLVVCGDQDTMFGEMDVPHESLPESYRAHGSLYEMRLPLLIWNQKGELPSADNFTHNLDLTRFLYR
jgi:phosphonoacetate hydrolase